MSEYGDSAKIDAIQNIRSRNNELWMELLRIALKHDRDGVRKILREINANDRAISNILEGLAQ